MYNPSLHSFLVCSSVSKLPQFTHKKTTQPKYNPNAPRSPMPMRLRIVSSSWLRRYEQRQRIQALLGRRGTLPAKNNQTMCRVHGLC